MPRGNDLVLSYGICLVLKCIIRQFLVETFKIFEVQRNSVNDWNSMCIVNSVLVLFVSFNSEVHNLPLVIFVRWHILHFFWEFLKKFNNISFDIWWLVGVTYWFKASFLPKFWKFLSLETKKDNFGSTVLHVTHMR